MAFALVNGKAKKHLNQLFNPFLFFKVQRKVSLQKRKLRNSIFFVTFLCMSQLKVCITQSARELGNCVLSKFN
jgi:hypothetical protein